MTKFDNVSCSQCGEDFGPGDHGFSHCDNHKPSFDAFDRGYKQALTDVDKIIEEKLPHYDGGYEGVLVDVRERLWLLPMRECGHGD